MPLQNKDTQVLFPISLAFLIAGLTVVWFNFHWGVTFIIIAVVAYPWFLSTGEDECNEK